MTGPWGNWSGSGSSPLSSLYGNMRGPELTENGEEDDSIYDWIKKLFGRAGSGTAAGPASQTSQQPPENITNPPPGPFNTTNIPGFDFTSYSDEDYQNLPVLRFLQGRMSPEEYANYAGGMASGAFGTELPLSGSMNMSNIMEILQNPDAADVLRSLYRSGNLNWDALVGLAAARAPAGGNAVPLSGIFT